MANKTILPESPIWAITCYFNTSSVNRRLKNYRLFRKRLNIPLLTVELSFNGQFDLGHGDAEVLLRRQVPDLLWHKERLLNLAVDALPANCEAVAWIDADVIFENETWYLEALETLSRVPILQPYTHYRDLQEDKFRAEDSVFEGDSFGFALSDRTIERINLEDISARHSGEAYNVGLTWVARTDLIRRHGLYDAFILGGGDRAMALAALGQHKKAVKIYRLNTARFEHYESWAKEFYEDIKGEIGYLPGDVLHLWHGDLVDRKYIQRVLDFSEFDFDPTVDIKIDNTGCWRWSTDKSLMHNYFAEYFHSRGM